MTTTTTAERGLVHHCPLCGEEDGLSVRVCDGAIQCCGCEAELTPEELAALARGLLRLAEWAAAVPCGEG
jgi:uncharacterized protein (DUF983 family)